VVTAALIVVAGLLFIVTDPWKPSASVADSTAATPAEATADGERVIYRLLDDGDRYAIEGYEDLVLKVGDPAALAFSLNGSAGRQLGPAGQPATAHITRENSRQFVGG
jgi:hypothetical protein